MSRNSNSTLMIMAADVFVGLHYNAYGLVITAIQKPVYVKTTTMQQSGFACAVIYTNSAIILLSVILTMFNALSYQCHASPHPP